MSNNNEEDLTLESEFTVHLPEHQILLSFNNDSGAENFQDWWFYKGKSEFQKYCKHASHYE